MSPTRKKSIWIGPPLQRLIASRRSHADDAVNVSGAINTAIERYLEIMRRHMPPFTCAEWCAIFDALNGTWLTDAWSPTYIFAEVYDSPGLAQKWHIEQAALVHRLQTLSYAESVAVADAAERFWAANSPPGDDGWRGIVAQIVGEKALAD